MESMNIGNILAPVGSEEGRRREERVRDRFWRTARRAARQVPFMDEVVAAYYAALDLETPGRVRGTLFAALAYFVMPVDAVPDILALVGFTDDIAVLTAVLAAIRPHIKESHRLAARRALAEQ